jgi:hypothetical protein
MKDVVKGGAFAVLAMENSTATDHPQGTCVAAAGEGVVCAPAAEAEGEQTAAAEGEQTAAAEGEQTAATEDEQSAAAEGADNQTETQGGDGGNNDDNANDENGN